jgi:hypothetical protein
MTEREFERWHVSVVLPVGFAGFVDSKFVADAFEMVEAWNGERRFQDNSSLDFVTELLACLPRKELIKVGPADDLRIPVDPDNVFPRAVRKFMRAVESDDGSDFHLSFNWQDEPVGFSSHSEFDEFALSEHSFANFDERQLLNVVDAFFFIRQKCLESASRGLHRPTIPEDSFERSCLVSASCAFEDTPLHSLFSFSYDYKTVRFLGEGAQGAVHLVKPRATSSLLPSYAAKVLYKVTPAYSGCADERDLMFDVCRRADLVAREVMFRLVFILFSSFV